MFHMCTGDLLCIHQRDSQQATSVKESLLQVDELFLCQLQNSDGKSLCWCFALSMAGPVQPKEKPMRIFIECPRLLFRKGQNARTWFRKPGKSLFVVRRNRVGWFEVVTTWSQINLWLFLCNVSSYLADSLVSLLICFVIWVNMSFVQRISLIRAPMSFYVTIIQPQNPRWNFKIYILQVCHGQVRQQHMKLQKWKETINVQVII